MTDFIKPPENFSLNQNERASACWQKLKRYLEDANETDRKKNDSMSLDMEQTRNLRAMIAARKALLNLEN